MRTLITYSQQLRKLACFATLFFCIAWTCDVNAQTTLNPTADTDTQSDVAAGTNTVLNASQWNHLLLRFSLASVTGSVSNATLRIYQTSTSGAYTLNVNTTSNDTWNEGGTKPSVGSLIITKAGRTTAGYIDINVTAHVQSKMAGNKVVSVGLTTNLGSWTSFNSRQNVANKPQLVITTGTGSSLTVSPTSLNFSTAASAQNVSVSSNTSWTVTDNQTWITVTPTSGSGNASASISVTANSGAARNGTVTITGGGLTRTVAVSQSAASSTSGMKIGTNFWNVGWQARNEFVTGVNWATTTNPWNPTFLQEMSTYSVIRPMDWGPTNNSTVSTWSQRIQKTANHYTTAGIAYEWQIDLCNRLGADLWVTVPHLAEASSTNDYAKKLAELINAQLNSGLKVYVEYSNETWNNQFTQYAHAVSRSNQLGFGNPQGAEGAKFHVYAAVRIFREFENVFGINSSRLVKVIAGHSPNLYRAGFHLDAINDPSINPLGVVVNAYAIAPYFGHGTTGFTALQNSMQAAINESSACYNLVTSRGLKLIAYEGGQHTMSDADNTNRNSGMYQLYLNYFNGVDNYFEVFCHYNHVATYGPGGAWGAKEFIGQSNASAHKYRAIIDYVAANGGRKASEVENVIEELPANKVFAIHPNPATSKTKVVLNDSYRGPVEVVLLSSTGHVLQTSNYSKTLQNFEAEVNVSDFNSGLYFIKMLAGKRHIEKLVKK